MQDAHGGSRVTWQLTQMAGVRTSSTVTCFQCSGETFCAGGTLRDLTWSIPYDEPCGSPCSPCLLICTPDTSYWFLVVWQPWMSWQRSMNSEKGLMTAFPTPLVGPGVQLGFWTGFRICGMMALLLEGDLLHICEQLRCFLLQWTPKGILSNSAHRWPPGLGWSSAVELAEHLWRPEFDPQTINKAKPQQRADHGDCCASGFDFFWTLPSLSMCSHAMKFI